MVGLWFVTLGCDLLARLHFGQCYMEQTKWTQRNCVRRDMGWWIDGGLIMFNGYFCGHQL